MIYECVGDEQSVNESELCCAAGLTLFVALVVLEW